MAEVSAAALRILWLKTAPLHPIDTGGKIRTYNLLKQLKEHHHITYLALCPKTTPPSVLGDAGEYSHEQIWIDWPQPPKHGLGLAAQLAVNLIFSSLPFVIAKYRSAQMARTLQRLEQTGTFDLVVCDFLTPSVNLTNNHGASRIPRVLFQHNVESMIWARMAEQADGWLRRWYFGVQSRRMTAYEQRSCRQFDRVLAVSDHDAQTMKSSFGLDEMPGVVSTGVDIEYFSPPPADARRPYSLIFHGSMDWMPNIDGAIYFVEEILPLIKARFPAVTLTIVGRNPTPAILALAERFAHVTVTGTVADVRPHLAACAVTVVPLRVGGGTRIKIFEAMATGIPVVSTSIGAEGLPVEAEKHMLVGDTADALAAAVERLFEEPRLGERLAASALELVRRDYSWKSVTTNLAEELRNVLPHPTGGYGVRQSSGALSLPGTH